MIWRNSEGCIVLVPYLLLEKIDIFKNLICIFFAYFAGKMLIHWFYNISFHLIVLTLLLI